MIRVAILFTNYGPYHLARVNRFSQSCFEQGWETIGLETARQEEEYPWQVSLKDLPFKLVSIINDQSLEQVKLPRLLSGLFVALNHLQPDVVAIAGYARPEMLAALAWCKWHRKPAVLLSETTEQDAPRHWLQESVKRWLLRGYGAALVGGSPHARYLIKLGMSPKAIFPGYDVVENKTFDPSQIRTLPLHLKRPYFLSINRFVLKKNLPRVLQAYTAYRQIVGNRAWDLVLCGDGPLKPQIQSHIIEHSLQEQVHLPGFLQQNQLLPYFAHASGFIHASTQEQWGLVVNEAMAAGLPVVVSNRCGCFEDLVIEGINGFGFDPENTEQLTNLMIKVSSDAVDLEKMGSAALQHIQKFLPDYFAQSLTKAINYAVEHR